MWMKKSTQKLNTQGFMWFGAVPFLFEILLFLSSIFVLSQIPDESIGALRIAFFGP